MGPRPGSIAAIEADPRGALIAELERSPSGQVAASALPSSSLPSSALPSSSRAFRTVADANAKRQARTIVATRAQDEAKRQQMSEASSMVEGAGQDGNEMAAKIAADAVPDPGRPIYLEEAKLRTETALNAEIGFTERLVWFWSNHFCVSADKIQSMSGAYEREAIRPHVLGRFADMLLAAEGHPAMLFYLDNTASMGPNSIAGINRNRGLNENFARETLELHTLGVRSGYSQDDVISFANVLTGWTLVPPGDNPEHGGEFTFNPRLHEPGAKTVMGKVYEDEGVEQGRAVLRDLAAHPATATHLATKLARHFVSDTPPAPLVEKMAKAFLDTGGDLKETAKVMVASAESWTQTPTKLKRPSEWVVGIVRATGITQVDPVRFTAGQALLGEPLWRPSSPKGFPDDEASWIDGIGRRLDVANNFAERVADKVDPHDVIEAVFGSTVSAEVKETVGRAESRQQALALLFMSAELQRR
ncbi:Uncharacterized conserved protein, DUF1800 family [Bradyrhizobium canariense]|uniref:Uncharacterized conserved protein, DUF1800 family n=2 Tax=Bradyrhizobium canariense TaxID=255045 RepID=A0A1H1U418_9BRAD|nr:Uncharacterized conserved protein, DUF1800 family [Bradyrhizobium canariense]